MYYTTHYRKNGDAPNCFTLIPIPGLDFHRLPGLVEERMEQRSVAHEEKPLQARQVPVEPGHVHQQAVQSLVHQCVGLYHRVGSSG